MTVIPPFLECTLQTMLTTGLSALFSLNWDTNFK